jgi:hypothetical protein
MSRSETRQKLKVAHSAATQWRDAAKDDYERGAAQAVMFQIEQLIDVLK